MRRALHNELWLRVELFTVNHMMGSHSELCLIGAIVTLPTMLKTPTPHSYTNAASDDTLDVTDGTQFHTVRKNAVCAPRLSGLPFLQASITGVTCLEILGSLRTPFRIAIAGTVADEGNRMRWIKDNARLPEDFKLTELQIQSWAAAEAEMGNQQTKVESLAAPMPG